jgi:hypothetical protein
MALKKPELAQVCAELAVSYSARIRVLERRVQARVFSRDEKIGLAVFAVLVIVVTSIMFAVVP